MKKIVIIGVIIASIVGGILASPLFYDIEVDEPLPVALNKLEPGLTFEKFSSMDDENRENIVGKMPEKVKEMIMNEAQNFPTVVSESMNDLEDQILVLKSGSFEGLAGHQAEGLAKIIKVRDSTFLRFEDFEVTNGPDLRVYITQDGDVKNGIHLEKLKGSRGNQNYDLQDINISQFDIVVIYCQPFGAYFGEAKLQ